MTKLQPAVAGDSGDTRKVTLNGTDALTNVSSVRATVKHTTTGEVAVLSASVTNAVTNEVTIELGTWLSDGPTVGGWEVQVETTWVSGDVLTWPGAGTTDMIWVSADHD